jgi:hypothetical protein
METQTPSTITIILNILLFNWVSWLKHFKAKWCSPLGSDKTYGTVTHFNQEISFKKTAMESKMIGKKAKNTNVKKMGQYEGKTPPSIQI